MILGLGIDITPVDRIADIVGRHGSVFADKVFTETERKYAGEGKKVTAERLAARWAAKEAAIKALGSSDGLRWHDMEVVNAEDGSPSMIFRGAAKKQVERLGVTRTILSLSHAGGVAVAVIILEGDQK